MEAKPLKISPSIIGSIVAFAVILVIVAGGFGILGYMDTQAKSAITAFNAEQRPRLEKACKDQNATYLNIKGRGDDRSWKVTCKNDTGLLDITVSLKNS